MNTMRTTAGAVVCLLSMAAASTALAFHDWNGYHWARTTPSFILKSGDNVSSAWDSYLDTAIGDWSQSSVVDLAKVSGGTKPKSCRPTAGRMEVCSEFYGGTGWLGVAQIWLSSGHIGQGTVKVNDTYFSSGTYNTTAWRNLVMCQEIGHVLGLNHNDENFNNTPTGTCMDYSSDPDPNQHPNKHDYDTLEYLYAHTDSFNSYDDTPIDTGGSDGGGGGGPPSCRGKGCNQGAPGLPPAFEDLDFSDVGSWGRIISMSKNGRYTTHELDFGNGNKVITHVIWAL